MLRTRLADYMLKGNKIIDLEQEKAIFEITSHGEFEIDGRPLRVARDGNIYLLGLHLGCLSKAFVKEINKPASEEAA